MSLHLHFDLVGGIAGDMTVAALLDLGADLGTAPAGHDDHLAALRGTLETSGLPFTALTVERTWRGGMAGHAVTVAPETDPPARTWLDIRALLAGSRLPERVVDRATAIFERLAEAEARTHGCTPDEVHFHEVGAMDAIVDVVASAVLIEQLDASSFSCGTVPICEGEVRCDHGVLPLPAPATARLLHGFRLQPIPGGLETVTPTGAAILATLCPDGGAPRPPTRQAGTGVGLGSATLADRPNVLRVMAGAPLAAEDVDRDASPIASGTAAVVLEANIDDMDPRVFGHVAERLTSAGALDVSLLPLQMKKGRPGTLLQIQCRPALAGALTELVLRETTTLGVRRHDVLRHELDRRHVSVDTRWGPVPVKLGLLGAEVVNGAPEYEACRELAERHGVPVKQVLAAALAGLAETPMDPTP